MMYRSIRTGLRAGMISLFALTGMALADVSDGGGGGGTATDPSQRDAVVQHVLPLSEARLQARHLELVRQSVLRYYTLAAAQQAGYEPCDDCRGGGRYYVREDLIDTSSVDLAAPQVLWYEPLVDGRKQLVAVKYVVRVESWHEEGNAAPPTLFGRAFARDDALLGEPTYVLLVPAEAVEPVGGFAF